MLMDYGNTVCLPDWKVEEKIPPGYSRVYYIYAGEVSYQDDHCCTMLKPGFLYLFPSAVPYGMRHNLSNPLNCTFLHLDIFPSIVTNLTEISVDDNLALKYLLLSLAEDISSKEVKMIYALADAIELYFTNHQLTQSINSSISQTLSYISDNIQKEISVADLCDRAGYCAQYFIRLFKHNIGISPHRYIINIRLKEAKKLLRTDMPIIRIADATGYNDVKSFSRSFKDNLGLSPTEYRKTFKVQP